MRCLGECGRLCNLHMSKRGGRRERERRVLSEDLGIKSVKSVLRVDEWGKDLLLNSQHFSAILKKKQGLCEGW